MIRGYVLAGGESSRMQGDGPAVDKALLPFAGENLLRRALRKVEQVCGNATILGGPSERCKRFAPYGRTVQDAVSGVGPLAGLAAALEDASEGWVLIAPVDLPLLPARALRALLDGCVEGEGPRVATFQTQDQFQPVPVALHVSVRAVIEQALTIGEHKLQPVLRRAAAAGGRELRVLRLEHPDECLWFSNVNTPDDLKAAQERLKLSNEFAPGASE